VMKTLVIGSADIDLFLTLPQGNSFVESQKSVTFTLGDKIPTDMQGMMLGGNGANVSAGTKRLGMETSFYTFVGTDLLSRQIKETLEQEHIILIDHPGAGENTSLNLIFNFTTDRIIFSHHEVKNHGFDPSQVKDFQALYLTSIGREWINAYKQISSFIHSQQLAVAFSPGSPQLADLEDVVYEIIAASKILFVNKQEGEHLIEKRGEKAADIKELLSKLSVLGPEIVSITDGKEGGYALSQDTYYHIPSFDEKTEGVDKTGAGDAYASAFFSAYLLKGDVVQAMSWGGVNAHSVIGKIGAQPGLLTVPQIEEMLSSRPDFRAEKI
ncbi:MAG: carbohydrate kinase family protein, partial [Candidatus Levyibacteriota bacterium]